MGVVYMVTDMLPHRWAAGKTEHKALKIGFRKRNIKYVKEGNFLKAVWVVSFGFDFRVLVGG